MSEVKAGAKYIQVPVAEQAPSPDGKSILMTMNVFLDDMVFSSTIWRNPAEPEWQKAWFRLKKLFQDCKDGDIIEVSVPDHQKLCQASSLPTVHQIPPVLQWHVMKFLMAITCADDSPPKKETA